jgi:hypothetical protein
MRKLLSLFIFVSLSQSAYSTSTDVLKTTPPKKEEAPAAAPAKKEETTVLKVEEKKTININNNTSFKAEQKATKKSFCGKKSGECEKSCNKWLKSQKKSLGKKLLTATCEEERSLYGEEESGCMNYICKGEVEYIIR